MFDFSDSKNWNCGRFCESKFISEDSLPSIRSWIDTQEWKDGLDSLIWVRDSDAHQLKTNFETKDTIPDHLFWSHVDSNSLFFKFTCPKSSSTPLCTVTRTGGYYKPHFDKVTIGQFSTTIFLTDPDEYEGGELVLWIDGREVFFKPKAGEGVTYETGIGHRVNPVTKGERLALVFWTHSHWANLEDFDKWKYYSAITSFCDTDKDDNTVDNLYKFYNNTYNIHRLKSNHIFRKYIHLFKDIPEETFGRF
jgi:PKHD-type hydroxylase